jgi:hypothetical protein
MPTGTPVRVRYGWRYASGTAKTSINQALARVVRVVRLIYPPRRRKKNWPPSLFQPLSSSAFILFSLPLGRWHGDKLVTLCYALCYARNVQHLPIYRRCYAVTPQTPRLPLVRERKNWPPRRAWTESLEMHDASVNTALSRLGAWNPPPRPEREN